MTADELIRHLNEKFGFWDKFPETYEVDHETYANCCQKIFSFEDWKTYGIKRIPVSIGPHSGLIFKGIELILKERI